MSSKTKIAISQMRFFEREIIEDKSKKAWMRAFPESPAEAIEALVANLIAKGANQKQVGLMLEKVYEMDERQREHARDMVEKRFAPDQIHLFIHSNPEERDELTQVWQKSAIERMKEVAAKIPKAVGTATKSVLIGGSMGCVVFIVAGAVLGDMSLAASGRAILGFIADPPEGLDGAGLALTSVNQVVAASVSLASSAALIGAKASSNIFKELLKADPGLAPKNAKKVLEDRVIGEFFRMKGDKLQTLTGSFTQDEVARELETIPFAYLPLLTHFKSREFVGFLVADDEAREKIMSMNPPDADQKIDTLRALHPGKLRRAWETTRQSLNAWEGRFARDHGVTLESSFGALRDAKNRAKEQPAEEPHMALPAIR